MSRKSPRNSFLKTVQKAFALSLESECRQMPIRELIDQERERSYSRRKMLGDLGKAGIAVASAGILDSCNKASGWMGTRIEIPGAANGTNIASQPTIAIVGAGMAGLNCAYQLSRSGYTSTIYEASTRSGGRIYTKSNIVGNGIYGELGGQFIDSNHTDMINLCKEFNLPHLDTESPTEAVLFRDDFLVDGGFYTESRII